MLGRLRMFWISLVYWTLAIPLCFIGGYHESGNLVLRLRKTIPRYAKGWCPAQMNRTKSRQSGQLMSKNEVEGVRTQSVGVRTDSNFSVVLLRPFRTLRWGGMRGISELLELLDFWSMPMHKSLHKSRTLRAQSLRAQAPRLRFLFDLAMVIFDWMILWSNAGQRRSTGLPWS